MSLWNTFSSYVADPLDLLGMRAGRKGVEEQLQAQRTALAENQAEATRTRSLLEQMSQQGRADLAGYNDRAASALGGSYRDQQGYYGRAGESLGAGSRSALESLYGGYAQGTAGYDPQAGLTRYTESAASPVSAYDVTGRPSSLEWLMGRGDALEQRMRQPIDLEQDPGYRFRLQQGEQALRRQQAAVGNRAGGSALKALLDYNQGMASQEYGNAFARRQAENAQLAGLLGQQYGAAGNVDQMRLSALLNQAGRSDAAALNAQQNQMALAQLGYGARGQQAQMAYGTGQQAAGLQGQYGSALANLYGQQAGAAQAQGGALASLYSNTGANLGNMAVSQAGQNTALAQALMGAQSNYAQYPGMVNQWEANQKGQMVGAAGSLFGSLFGARGGANAGR